MKESEELALREQLLEDEAARDRDEYDYTVDALMENGILPLSIWPESNKNMKDVIDLKVDYESLPFDVLNEFHKGMNFSEQQDIIIRNEGSEVLCEALNMNACMQEGCELHNAKLTPPVCGEYKMVFEKNSD